MARVVLALSGGVDSSVAAHLLLEAGHPVVAVTFRLLDPGESSPQADAVDRARRVAERLGIPLEVMDLRKAFRQRVIRFFVEGYRLGLTPNPCVLCNRVIKFWALGEALSRYQAQALATGHYARSREGRLLRARDRQKDQSYFLAWIPRRTLPHLHLPLGDRTKAEVRRLAHRLGLEETVGHESQDICFVPDDYRAFLQPYLGEKPGEIVDSRGRVLGHHPAYYAFTPGQRRGLGVALGRRLYVLRVDPHRRRVTVGPREALFRQEAWAYRFRWLVDPPPWGEPVALQVRYRTAPVPARVEPAGPFARLRFDEPVWNPAPGQFAVAYRGDELLGGGLLVSEPDEEAAQTLEALLGPDPLEPLEPT